MKTPLKINVLLFVVIACLASILTQQCTPEKFSNTVEVQSESGPADFAKKQLEKTITQLQVEHKINFPMILLQVDENALSKQAYEIIPHENKILVKGGDSLGVMYGGLELAEYFELNKKVPDEVIKGKPYLKKRGIKFNIPLDARTPSYDDTGDAAQKNIGEMWNFEFWTEFFDNMALHRYNNLTLWNPHPFPSMVKMSDYPNVALDDVCVTTLKPEGIENEWGEPQLVSSNIVENLKTIKTITIDEKITFWKKVMAYAATRGVDLYFITWNVCPNSVAVPVPPFTRTYDNEIDEEDGKYGVTHRISDLETVAYLRASVKQLLLTYPLLKGIGVTAGENMPKETDISREAWLWDSYGKGILDAKKEQPNRKVNFIHRVWNSNFDEIMKYWKKYPDNFELSFKYAKARLYSSPDIPFANRQIEQMKAFNLKSWWNLRNDDIFVYRWGDPNYVRQFLKNFNKNATAGYHMGSDGYVWGREFISKQKPNYKRELEISKHWYNFMLWGRLGYNPELNKDFFVRKLASKYPNVKAELLYNTWQTASKIFPQVNVFHWQDWDYQFSVETCNSANKGFHNVLLFITNRVMKGQDILNPKQFAHAIVSGDRITSETPVQIADKLMKWSEEAIAGVDELESETLSKSLEYTCVDMKAMAYAGLYYAYKIRSANELAFYQENKNKEHKVKALEYMQEALKYWRMYSTLSVKYYNSQMLARPGLFDWEKLTLEVEKDVLLVKEY